MLETKLLMIRYLWESEENHLFTYLHKHFYPYGKITKKQEDLKRACLILLVLESTKYKSRPLTFPPYTHLLKRARWSKFTDFPPNETEKGEESLVQPVSNFSRDLSALSPPIFHAPTSFLRARFFATGRRIRRPVKYAVSNFRIHACRFDPAIYFFSPFSIDPRWILAIFVSRSIIFQSMEPRFIVIEKRLSASFAEASSFS